MKERTKFLIEWERQWNEGEGRLNVSALCRQFGVSRDSGHRLIARYQAADHDLDVARDQSRCPHTLPTKTDETMEDIVVKMRKEHPRWGPKKLRALIVGKHPRLPVPSASTIGEILKRRGLSEPRKRRSPRSTPFTQPFADVVAPNTTWCVDFKGQFRMKDGKVCYPLTIIDAHTRFLIRCEALLEPTFDEVKRVFDSAFQEFGVPVAIRSDNGPPFATVGPGSLSQLSVWWTRLGIRHERITPGKPQENGRQERFHRTLKAETATPPRANLAAQQRAFDLFRREYNQVRPHEALGQKPPSSVYRRSARTYPRKLVTVQHEPWNHYLDVNRRGYVVWDGTQHFLANSLAGEEVELRPARGMFDDELFDVFFFEILVGQMRKTTKGWQLSSPKRPRRAN